MNMDEFVAELVNEAAWQFLANHPVDTATDSDMQLRQICLDHLSHDYVIEIVVPDIKLSAEFYRSLSQPED